MPPEFHFENKPPILFETWLTLVEYIQSLGQVEIIAVKSSIQFRINSTFLSLKLKKNGLLIDFFLKEENALPFIRNLKRFSKNRVAHNVELNSPGDITPALKKLLKKSYTLFKEK